MTSIIYIGMELSRNVQSGNPLNLKSCRSAPFSGVERSATQEKGGGAQATDCAANHSRYFTGGSPCGLRVYILSLL